MKQMGLKGFVVAILVGVMAGMCSGCATLGNVDTAALVDLIEALSESAQVIIITYVETRAMLAALDAEDPEADANAAAQRAARRAEVLLELNLVIEMAERSGLSGFLRQLDVHPNAVKMLK